MRARRATSLILFTCATTVLGAACSTDDESKNTRSGGPAEGLAVVNSDYKSTSISLVDPTTGTLSRDNCLHSGSATPELSLALSGDVVLPSQTQPGHELVVIDRGNNTLTWVDPRTCGVLRQLNVGGDNAANPHDIVALSPNKAYVTRYGSGTGPAAEGQDLLIIDPAGRKSLGAIDLRPYATAAAAGQTILPSPERAVLAADGKVYVTLGNLSSDAMAGGPGRVLIIDPATDAVAGQIELSDLKNCAGLAYSAANKSLVVTCGGVFGDATQMATSGVANVDLSVSPPSVKIVMATTFGRAVSFSNVAALGAPEAFTQTAGDFSGTPGDQLWAFSFLDVAPKMLLETKGAYILGGMTVDAAGTNLFVAEADMTVPRLHIFGVAIAGLVVTEKTAITTNPAGGLPPREVAWY